MDSTTPATQIASAPPQPEISDHDKIQRIDDRLSRINLKSKRMRTLIKKTIELSQLCDLDISLVVRDREMNKFIIYNSGKGDTGLFTAD